MCENKANPMNRFWLVIIMLLLTTLVTSKAAKADDALIMVDISKSIDPTRQKDIPGIQLGYSWGFDSQNYTALIVVDEQSYNKIRSQRQKRGFDYRIFHKMVNEGTEALDKLIDELNQVMSRTWSDEQKINFVLAFVHALPYTDDVTTGFDEFYKYPTETLTEGAGDCEDTSMLFAAILKGMKYELVLIIPEGHVAVGVKGNFQGGFVSYENDKYYFCETTAKHWRVGDIPKPYVDVNVQVMPISSKQIPPRRVRPPTTPNSPISPSPQKALQNGINLYYGTRYNEAIKSLRLVLPRLNLPEERAKAYIYLAAAEAGFGKKHISEVKEYFKEALRQNPYQEFPNPKFSTWFEDVRRDSIGTLSISASLPQTEIQIYGNGIERKKYNFGTTPIELKLFKGIYTIEGIYEGEFVKETVTVEPNSHKRHQIEIPSIMEHEPVSAVFVGEIIPLTLNLTSGERPKQVKIYYKTTARDGVESERRMRLKHRSSELSTSRYEVDLPAQNRTGSIQYRIEAEFEDGRFVRHPKDRYSYHSISVIDDTPQPPKIILLDSFREVEVDQEIIVTAQVTGDTPIKNIYLFYGYSYSDRKPRAYEREPYLGRISTADSQQIRCIIPPQNQVGYIWYYLTATDSQGFEGQSERRRLKIKFGDKDTPPWFSEEPESSEKPTIAIPHRGIWATYGWSRNIFSDRTSVFNLNRGDAISLAYLHEGKTYPTFGTQFDYSYQNSPNLKAAFQWGPALGKSPIVFTLLGGIAGYRYSDATRITPALSSSTSKKSTHFTPIVGVGLKLYPFDRISIDAIGSVKLPSEFDTTYLYHYELGTRIYMNDVFNLRVGYGQWFLEGRKTTRMQVGFGITF